MRAAGVPTDSNPILIAKDGSIAKVKSEIGIQLDILELI